MKLRISYLIICLVTVFLGLASRKYSDCLPAFLTECAGDTLWAMMVYWGVCFLFPAFSRLKHVIIALAFSYCIEVSQLYHADWINAIRDTTLGALVLGFGFLWSDMVCYTVGVSLAWAMDIIFISHPVKR